MMLDFDFDFARVSRPASPRKLGLTSDGDSYAVDQPIRLVCVDTPETEHYAGAPDKAQEALDRCRGRLEDGTYDAMPQYLRDYMLERLTSDAARRHIEAGNLARSAFEDIKAGALTRSTGRQRRVAVIPAGELIDRYGRLLVYLAPWYSGTAKDPLPSIDHPDRRTLNLRMIESGWAAPFLIFPSIPKSADLRLLVSAADKAWADRRGIWSAQPAVLLGHEYRAAVKLGRTGDIDPVQSLRNAFYRYCVDLRNRKIVGTYEYFLVPPTRRLWIWPEDLALARRQLQLAE